MKDIYLESIRRFEGFNPVAKQDCSQLSNGYGTRARFAGETLSADEAESRFREAISSAERLVDGCQPDLDEGTKAALTSLTYNTGAKWMRDGLGDAIRRHDLTAAREIFRQYTTAGGHVLPGLISRRSEEVTWFGDSATVRAPVEAAANSAASNDSGPGKAAEGGAVSAYTDTGTISATSALIGGAPAGAVATEPLSAQFANVVLWRYLLQQGSNPSADGISDRREP